MNVKKNYIFSQKFICKNGKENEDIPSEIGLYKSQAVTSSESQWYKEDYRWKGKRRKTWLIARYVDNKNIKNESRSKIQ